MAALRWSVGAAWNRTEKRGANRQVRFAEYTFLEKSKKKKSRFDDNQ